MPRSFLSPRSRITWRGDEVAQDLMEASKETTYEIGKIAENFAKSFAHVEEGWMRYATGMVHPLNREVYHKNIGRWPPPEVDGTMADIREINNNFTTHITSLVGYAVFEEIVRGHKFIAPAVLIATRNETEVMRRMVRKHVR